MDEIVTTRPPIPDDIALRDTTVAHVAALRDRLAELQRRVSVLVDQLEASPRTPDGTGVVIDEAVLLIFAELARIEEQATTVHASARMLMSSERGS